LSGLFLFCLANDFLLRGWGISFSTSIGLLVLRGYQLGCCIRAKDFLLLGWMGSDILTSTSIAGGNRVSAWALYQLGFRLFCFVSFFCGGGEISTSTFIR
jgi:hypothetical protein